MSHRVVRCGLRWKATRRTHETHSLVRDLRKDGVSRGQKRSAISATARKHETHRQQVAGRATPCLRKTSHADPKERKKEDF
jgi:hypothetical protein